MSERPIPSPFAAQALDIIAKTIEEIAALRMDPDPDRRTAAFRYGIGSITLALTNESIELSVTESAPPPPSPLFTKHTMVYTITPPIGTGSPISVSTTSGSLDLIPDGKQHYTGFPESA